MAIDIPAYSQCENDAQQISYPFQDPVLALDLWVGQSGYVLSDKDGQEQPWC